MGVWLYDNYDWWVYAIHSAVCPAAHFEWGRSEIDPTKSPLSSALYEQAYLDALRYLRKRNLSPTHAYLALFRAKALRKWRIADKELGRERREAAIRGFVVRNASDHLTEPIPYPYCYWMREVLKEWLPRLDSSCHQPQGCFGPGAVAEKWSHVKRFTRLAKWVSQSEHWPEVVDGQLADANHVVARLCAVPKTHTKDRLITVEPAYNSFAQQYVRSYILESIHQGPLRGTTMDLGYVDGQAQQRALALQASKTGRLATLDLSDASDRIGWTHVQQVFPPHVLALLETTRSEAFESGLELPHCSAKARIPARIYAGMGNATTFAVETLFFAAFVYAYARAWGLPTFVRVFGDDIICSSQWAQHFAANGSLDRFPFFVVGADKSFWGADGLRESCGIFAYQGIDISSPKVDGYPHSYEGRIALCDLHTRLVATGNPSLRRLAFLIAAEQTVVNWPYRIEGYPSLYDDLAGSIYGYTLSPRTRWNRALYRREAWVPIRHPRYVTYSLDGQTARIWNTPGPEEFLPAVLLGQVGSTQLTLSRRPKSGPTSVRFPLKELYSWGHAWRPVKDASIS